MAEAGNRNVLAASGLKLSEWSEVGLRFDFAAKALTVDINGAKLSSAVRLNPAKVTGKTRVTGLRFATPAGRAAGISFYDVVQAAATGKD